jgi:hypothetical protein
VGGGGGRLGRVLPAQAGRPLGAREGVADIRVQRVGALLPVALLGALIALQTLTMGSRVAVDARVVGLGVALVAQWRRAPFLVVVTSACVATALVRLVA